MGSVQHRLPTTVQERETLGPSCGNVGEGQGIQGASLRFSPTVSDQICLQKARLRFIPVLEGRNGNLVFEEGSSWCGGHAVWDLLPRGMEDTIGHRSTLGEQLIAALLAEMQMSMPLKGLDKGGQERDQPFGTDLIGGFPCQEKGLLDFWPVVGETCLLASWFGLLWMI